MANTKISALTAATTPLAGTEVLPIVQSGATLKVANNDLRPKQIQSNATSGVLQVAGPAAAATRTMTVPDANFTVARTDAANSFTADQTLATGNLIQGTATKGFNFTANTPAAGMTSQLLNWYEEGIWTTGMTADGGTVTLSFDKMNYTRVGRVVTLSGEIVVSAISSPTGDIYISLPFTAAASSTGRSGAWSSYLGIAYTFTGTPGGPMVGLFTGGATKMMIRVGNNAGGATASGFLTAGTTFNFGFTYQCQ